MLLNSALISLFLSTPSARRATQLTNGKRAAIPISIHALREEGDSTSMLFAAAFFLFLSTPSARRATITFRHLVFPLGISIHALREEGDSKNRDKISIFKQIIQHSARI